MVMEEQEPDMELASERVPVPQIQKITKEAHVETSNKVTSSSRGKPRLRKKALHAAILKQMEFYFSDANLCKDRFLRNLIEENPYIDLTVFTRFNRIRDLNVDTTRIAKALQGSTLLQLSDDGTKVKRVAPITEKENIDDCTVYVQNLPPDADHELLSTIFSQYGQVVYVSVPRYKSNKKIKGFAFIEFDKPEYAQKCFKAFKKKGCVLPLNTSPNDLLSITTFDNADKDVTQCTRQMETDRDDEHIEEPNCTESSNSDELKITVNNGETHAEKNVKFNEESKNCKKPKKRKRSVSLTHETDDLDQDNINNDKETQESDEQLLTHKKVKSEVHNDVQNNVSDNQIKNENTNDVSDNSTGKSSVMHVDDTSSSYSMENTRAEDAGASAEVNEEHSKNNDKKKKRKRKRRSRMEDDSYTAGFQIMTKKDWKILRNKYLTLQRTKMKQLKQHLRKSKWSQWSNYEKNKLEKDEKDDEKEKTVKQENASTCRYTFTPGVIVKIDMDKPCTDTKSFKMELRGNNAVKYIDVEEGSYHAYIRCDTAEAAQALAQKSTEEKQATVLNGEEERVYWDKIAQDREEKLSKKVRVKQRGRDKLLKKAEKVLGKHIKFDEV